MTDQQRKLSRRDAIKVLGAAAGASVLATLPTKWSKPEITTGVLPAHAQTSACVTLTVEALIAGGIGIAQGPLPSSQTPGNALTSSPSGYSLVNPGYQAVWSCMSGCLQLAFVGSWRVTVTGPNPSQNDYTNATFSVLIDLATGLFDTSFNNFNNPPGSCGWT